MSNVAPVAGKLLIDGVWLDGLGESYERKSPATEETVWLGKWASPEQTLDAIESAKNAFVEWSNTGLESRIELCQRFADLVKTRSEELATLIARENGKPLWEARTEVAASVAKVANSIDSIRQRRWTTTEEIGDFKAVTRYKPHGVMFVIGPFNFPSHVPGGHIIPALLAGNTIVFKPSEFASAVGQWLVACWSEVGIPSGVINLVHGAADVGNTAVGCPNVDGVLFTGSQKVGTLLHQKMAGQPHRVLALEMGGNNPLIVHNTSDYRSAAITVILSAYITSGQRCTCTRRLIIAGQEATERLCDALTQLIPRIQVGLSLDEPQPFMGPLIHSQAAQNMLSAQEHLIEAGAEAILRMEQDPRSNALLTPALLKLGADQKLEDCEYFGPLLMVQTAADLDEAIASASATSYGLSAGFIGDDEQDFEHFLKHVKAGVVNWNRQTTGASGKLPFGGVGQSGNHHPSGYHAADYCSYPIASLQSPELSEAQKPVPGLNFGDNA